jgi:NAD-dependent SIR2 family protein deacetylase
VPHQGYHILKEFVDTKDYFCFTSNVDGHFLQVFPEDKVEECHGSLMYLQCTEPDECKTDIWSVTDHTHGPTLPLVVDKETFRAQDPLPTCKHCGRLARPNVMMFYDNSFAWDRADVQEKNFKKWLRDAENVQDKKAVVIEIGAGEYVPSVRNKSEATARRLGDNSVLIRINPRDYQIEKRMVNGAISLPMGGLEALAAIKERM